VTDPPTDAPAGDATFLALSGGIGGAKLALGLAQLLGSRLGVIVNTGDDFEHLGLLISPDVDTALYTLADIVNPQTGWGRRDETWTFMAALAALGGPTWFRLGDGDLATHIDRTARLQGGATATEICAHLADRLGVAPRILPMTDERVRTVVETDEGALAFQEYFVRRQCRPCVRAIRFAGAAAARPTPAILAALASPTLKGIVICPSNPWLSIAPILAVPGLAAALRNSGAPLIAVSPIIAGQAVKGPTAKIMGELGLECSSGLIARHYAGLIDAIVIDAKDGSLAADIGVPVLVTNTLMTTREDKVALARQCLALCARLAPDGAQKGAAQKHAAAATREQAPNAQPEAERLRSGAR
jgi:LPPG:FO 2-phospho-L-lactate transferase